VTTTAQPVAETASIELTGPDGQKRTFPVEGGLATIQYRRVVLRPGESLVLNWTPSK
jgi:hypothetical protein